MAEMEEVVGSGNVRLLGQRGATARVESLAQSTSLAQSLLPSSSESEIEEIAADEMEED